MTVDTTPIRSGSGAARSVRARIRQYELIREIGRGGMGTVYLARDTRLARRVAIKFLADATPAVAERFLVEARATARCNHENIVVIHEVEELEGQPYMVLEYLEGRSLRQLFDGTPMPPSRAVELVVPVVRALEAAHAAGLVHRDLKPENVFVTDTGQVKVLDFGIAKLAGEPDGDDAAVVGTLPYMAPEQWGADEIDARTDLWAVGILLFELVTGHHPISPSSRDALLAAASRLDEPMPALGVDHELDRITARCLAKRKSDRYANAGELLAALEPLRPRRRASNSEHGPYPGLTAFQEEDAERFFGRRAELARLVAVLDERPLAAVVGASGVGKSSLVRAGLVPELKRRGAWEATITRPGRRPLEALAATALEVTGERSDDARRQELAKRLVAEPGVFGEMVRGRARARNGRLLVFVDQFEELFTLADDTEARRAYLACLAGAADDALSPVRVVLSIRADFLDRVAESGAFVEALTPGIVFVAAADRADLRAALVEPARQLGFSFESDAIVDEMVEELASTAGALPLLQFAASRLWDERDAKRRLLTRAAHQRIGGVAGALASHADTVVAGLPARSRELAGRVFQRLVTPERTRDVVEVDDLLELGPDARAVLDQLVAARLLAIRSGTGPAVAELVHESLIAKWPALQRWLDQGHEDAAFLARVRTAARPWDDGGRSTGLLWRGEAEQDARRWARAYKGELGRREQAYLDAVFRLADRATRTRRLAVAGTMALLAALVVAAAVALVWIRRAETKAVEEADRAKNETERARAANDQLEAEKDRQAKLVEQLQRETAEREAARAAEAQASHQVELDRTELEHTNVKLRNALGQAETESKHAITESERARDEATRAVDARQAADVERQRAEDFARKEHDRAVRRGKISTTLR